MLRRQEKLQHNSILYNKYGIMVITVRDFYCFSNLKCSIRRADLTKMKNE